MKVAVLTLGCRVNQSESDQLEAELKEGGATLVSLESSPDYCVINTCTVTSKSDYQSRQLIRRAVRTGAKVIVTGCYAELSTSQAETIPGVARTVGNREKPEIARLITGKSPDVVFGARSKSRPYLKVQDGCDCRCSYCAVPLARGNSRSIPIDEVIRKVQGIADAGLNEVVLTGIHLGGYGRDLPMRMNLSGLVEKILKETSIHRVRLSSLEVNEIDERLLELMKGPRVCSHLHIPLQSGSDKVLGLMNRNYTSKRYRDAVVRISGAIPNLGLGTDIITGFPGEGRDEFKQTVDFVKGLPFTYLHVFPYSERKGTPACLLPARNARQVAQERARELIQIGLEKKEAFLRSQVGMTLEAIIEEKHNDDLLTGTTENYLKVGFKDASLLRGMTVACRAVGMEGRTLIADPL